MFSMISRLINEDLSLGESNDIQDYAARCSCKDIYEAELRTEVAAATSSCGDNKPLITNIKVGELPITALLTCLTKQKQEVYTH